MSDSSNEDALMARLQDLEDRLDWLSREAVVATDLDVVWIIVSAVLVFFMQVGFAMVSAFIREKLMCRSFEMEERNLPTNCCLPFWSFVIRYSLVRR